jgi:hypothetical protein
MHQTTCGEIHKNKSKIFKKKEIDLFFEKEAKKYINFKNKNCLYPNKIYIDSSSVNYLNDNSDNNDNIFFTKEMIRQEFDKCENISPYLGDIFLDLFFENKKIKKSINTFKFNVSKKKDFISTITDQNVKKIANIFFENFSLENTVNVEKYLEKDIKIIKSNNINFNIDFDFDFYHEKKVITNYSAIFLDGFIQTVGEIHHLLSDSNQNKKNYLIFCYGMSEDVKTTIMTNNKNRKTYVYPISFSISEENINILSDISFIHNSGNVITAKSGKTISQLFTKKEKIDAGKKIIIKNNSFSIDPVIKKNDITTHREYIKKRIKNSNNENNKNILRKRLNRFSSKNITFMIPELVWNQNTFIRDMDYMLRFFSNCSSHFVKYNAPDKKKFYYFSTESIFKLNMIIESFKNKIKNINTIIKVGEK